MFEASAVYGAFAGYAGNYLPWAVSRDGQRFLLQQPVSADRPPEALAPLVVVLNSAALRPRQ